MHKIALTITAYAWIIQIPSGILKEREGATQMQEKAEAKLLTIEEAAQVLGAISPWTLRKHIERGSVAVVHIGRRVFLHADETARIGREGLPPLKPLEPNPQPSKRDGWTKR
jgi:hypothetical protein